MDDQFVDIITRRVMELMEVDLIPVEASARHIHLSKADLVEIFGETPLTKKKDLSQPGQYQYNERVRLIGPKGVISGVAILGPSRGKTQVEITMTDAFALGIKPPIRDSGDTSGSESIFIASERGIVLAAESVIIAKRHIHMTEPDAEHYKVRDGESVRVKIFSQRPVIFEDVLIRVKESYQLAMHIDLDEANASGYVAGTFCSIVYDKASKRKDE